MRPLQLLILKLNTTLVIFDDVQQKNLDTIIRLARACGHKPSKLEPASNINSAAKQVKY
jgi:hypothetical protein